MRLLCLLTSRLVVLLLLAGFACAQGVGTSGEIKGAVVDPSGAAVANASVIAVETAKGIQHSTVTDESGHYRFRELSPTVYDITAQGQGFAPEMRKDVKVVLGETAIIDFSLRLSSVTNEVEVRAEAASAPMVNVERAS